MRTAARIIRKHSGTHLSECGAAEHSGDACEAGRVLNAPERRALTSRTLHVDAEELRDIEQQVNDEIR